MKADISKEKKAELQKESRKSNTAFHAAVKKAVLVQDWSEGVSDVSLFETDRDLIENDWSKGDADYRRRITEATQALGRGDESGGTKRSDIFQWIAKELSPRVTKVNEHFAEKYGWGLPEGRQSVQLSG
ncbi:MAG: hypothetical protein IPG23_00285 [Burkholderiales bacterium]|nr:hypothetical protein [Burkholderiales bacterium]